MKPIVIWPDVKGRPPSTSLRGATIVFGAQANAHVHPVFAGILNAHAAAAIPRQPRPYVGDDLVLEGEEPAEVEPTLEQEERDAEFRAGLRA